MHKEGSNIFLKQRAFGFIEFAYLILTLMVIFWLTQNQFSFEIESVIESYYIPKITAIAGLLICIFALINLRIFPSLMCLYISATVVAYPNADYWVFIKVIFYEMPQVLFWIIPNNIVSSFI